MEEEDEGKEEEDEEDEDEEEEGRRRNDFQVTVPLFCIGAFTPVAISDIHSSPAWRARRASVAPTGRTGLSNWHTHFHLGKTETNPQ